MVLSCHIRGTSVGTSSIHYRCSGVAYRITFSGASISTSTSGIRHLLREQHLIGDYQDDNTQHAFGIPTCLRPGHYVVPNRTIPVQLTPSRQRRSNGDPMPCNEPLHTNSRTIFMNRGFVHYCTAAGLGVPVSEWACLLQILFPISRYDEAGEYGITTAYWRSTDLLSFQSCVCPRGSCICVHCHP